MFGNIEPGTELQVHTILFEFCFLFWLGFFFFCSQPEWQRRVQELRVRGDAAIVARVNTLLVCVCGCVCVYRSLVCDNRQRLSLGLLSHFQPMPTGCASGQKGRQTHN